MNVKRDSLAESLGRMHDAVRCFSEGGVEYQLRRLAEHSEALLTVYSPIKEGEEAVIASKVDTSGGWQQCRKHLRVGTVGKVLTVDYYGGHFRYDFVPHKQWWHDGKKWKRKGRLHSYRLSDLYLSPVGENANV